MDQLQTKTGNPLANFKSSLWFLLILCVPNFTKYSYHEKVLVQLYAYHKGVVVRFSEGTLCHLVMKLCPKTGDPLEFVLSSLCFINMMCS